MYIISSILFVVGIITGGCYGWFYLQTPVERTFSFLLGGFLGSAAGALFFIYSYFSSRSYIHTEEDDISNESVGLVGRSAEKTLLLNGAVNEPENELNAPLKRPVKKTPSNSNFSSPHDIHDPHEEQITQHTDQSTASLKPWWMITDKKQRQIRKLEKALEKLKKRQQQ